MQGTHDHHARPRRTTAAPLDRNLRARLDAIVSQGIAPAERIAADAEVSFSTVLRAIDGKALRPPTRSALARVVANIPVAA